ncbi:hypothetical protein OBBRIDRAFT_734811 [Obba rivulosa]|uniref:JmjC domain-containing protein n=1 Tax=Obba rivulosa TaxID=1052685 RepID=A0A8E2DMN9_9APHY|nr:hypothetical protein OBBRIDRAFT_734811 [Obba rivulosa]
MTLATSGVSGAQALGVPVNSPQTLTADDYEAERIQSTTEAHEYRSDVPSNSSETPARPTCQGWTLIRILEAGERFRHIPRISALRPQDELWQAIREHETAGIPLIIEDWHKHPQWPSNMFDVEWLVQNCPDEVLHVRNMHDRLDRDMLLPEFIERSRKQPAYVSPDEVERFYGKDAFCPPEWKIWLEQSEVLPAPVIPCGTNDILQHLPESSSVESLMCYLGIGDTFTPCHKDLCASSGQNIMCYTENGGSSYWFMTASSDAPAAAAYFSNTLGQELDWETHVATVREFAAAPFTVYVAEQKVGDLVLVPPRSCHQVVNHGGLTVKMSWSRMTVRGLQTALRHELPLYRRVCRPEQYRVKSLLHRTLLQYTTELEEILARTSDSPSGSSRGDSAVDLTKQSARLSDLETLIQLFEELLCEEYTKSHASLSQIIHSTRGWAVVPGPMRAAGTTLILRPPSTIPGTLADDHGDKQSYNFACDFCGADMFQSFFECRDCVLVQDVDAVLGNGDGLLICAPCYVEGRSCLCEEMEPVQCRPFGDLLRDRNRAAEAIVRCHGTSDTKYKIWTERSVTYF